MAKQIFHGVGAIPTGKKKQKKKKVAARAWKPVKSARLTPEQKAAHERTLKAKAELRKAEREERRLKREQKQKIIKEKAFKEKTIKKKAEREKTLRENAAKRKAEKTKAKPKPKVKAKPKGNVVKKWKPTGKEELKNLKIKKHPVIENFRRKAWNRNDVKYQLTMEADYINNETGEIKTVESYSHLSRGYGAAYLKAAEEDCVNAGLGECGSKGSKYHWGLYEILNEQWIKRSESTKHRKEREGNL